MLEKEGVCHAPLRDVRLMLHAAHLCMLTPSKISGLRPKARVKDFGLSERSEFPKFSAADRAVRPEG